MFLIVKCARQRETVHTHSLTLSASCMLLRLLQHLLSFYFDLTFCFVFILVIICTIGLLHAFDWYILVRIDDLRQHFLIKESRRGRKEDLWV